MGKRIQINPWAQPRAIFTKRTDLRDGMKCLLIFLFVFVSFYVCGLQRMFGFLEIYIHTFSARKKFRISVVRSGKRRISKITIGLPNEIFTKCCNIGVLP